MKAIHPPTVATPRPGKGRSPLPPEALTAFRSIQTTRFCSKGQELFLEGQAPQGIYILYSGCVELFVTDAHGRQVALGRALPGDILGLSAVLSGKYHEETAVADITCQTGFVKCADFLRFLDHHPEAAFWVVQLLSDRVTTTLEQLSCSHHLPLKGSRE